MTRGSNYSWRYSGESASCDIKSGKIDIRGPNYSVTLEVAPLLPPTWESLVAKLAKKICIENELKKVHTSYSVSTDLQEAFIALLPTTYSEIQVGCSCQGLAQKVSRNASTICVHVILAWFVVARKFHEDPWALFLFRGKNREEVFDAIHQHRAKKVDKLTQNKSGDGEARRQETSSENRIESPVSGALCLKNKFWGTENLCLSLPSDLRIQPALKEPGVSFPDSLEFFNNMKFNEEFSNFFTRTNSLINPIVGQFNKVLEQLPTTVTTISVRSKETFQKKLHALKQKEHQPPKKKPRSSKHLKDQATKNHTREGTCPEYYFQVDTTPPRLVSLNSTATLQELGEKINPQIRVQVDPGYQFYHLQNSQNFSIHPPGDFNGESLLRKLATIPDMDQVLLSQVFPNPGDRVLFRPDLHKNTFHVVKLLQTLHHHLGGSKPIAKKELPPAPFPTPDQKNRECEVNGDSKFLSFHVQGPDEKFLEISGDSTMADLAGLILRQFNLPTSNAYKYTNPTRDCRVTTFSLQARKNLLNEYFRHTGQMVFFYPDISQTRRFPVLLVQACEIGSTLKERKIQAIPSPKQAPPHQKKQDAKLQPRERGQVCKRINNAHQIQFGGCRYHVDPKFRGNQLYIQGWGKDNVPTVADANGHVVEISLKKFGESLSKIAPNKLPPPKVESHQAEVRHIDKSGRLNYRGHVHYINPKYAGQEVKVNISMGRMLVLDEFKHPIRLFRSHLLATKSLNEQAPLEKLAINKKAKIPPPSPNSQVEFRRIDSLGFITTRGTHFFIGLTLANRYLLAGANGSSPSQLLIYKRANGPSVIHISPGNEPAPRRKVTETNLSRLTAEPRRVVHGSFKFNRSQYSTPQFTGKTVFVREESSKLFVYSQTGREVTFMGAPRRATPANSQEKRSRKSSTKSTHKTKTSPKPRSAVPETSTASS